MKEAEGMFRRITARLILASMMVALFAVPARAETPYMDVLGRYSFAPPAGFSFDLKKSSAGYVAFSNPDQQATLYIYSAIVTNSSLDDYVNRYITNQKKDARVQLLSDQPSAVTVDGLPGRQLEYVLTTDSGQRHYLVMFALNGNVLGRLYAVTPTTAWDVFAPQAAAALGGFHFLTATYPTTYTDPAGRYSFTLPLGWQHEISQSKQDGTKDGFIGFNPDGSVYIDPIPAPTGVTLEQYVAAELSDLLDVGSTIETSQQTASPTTIATLPALQWEFFETSDNVRYHHRLIWFYSGSIRYRVSVNTRDDHWDAFLPQATLVLNSLKITS